MINPVFRQTELLKEYVKTLAASECILPGVSSRQWGKEFSRAELDSIYSCLMYLLKTANPAVEKVLIDDFREIGKPGMYLHWFVFRHWQAIIQLLTTHPTLSSRHQLSLH